MIALVLAGIGGIAWLIRLEARVNANGKEIERVDTDQKDTWEKFDLHRSNATVHFNAEVAREVDRRQGERMGRIENDVKEIKEMVKEMVGSK